MDVDTVSIVIIDLTDDGFSISADRCGISCFTFERDCFNLHLLYLPAIVYFDDYLCRYFGLAGFGFDDVDIVAAICINSNYSAANSFVFAFCNFDLHLPVPSFKSSSDCLIWFSDMPLNIESARINSRRASIGEPMLDSFANSHSNHPSRFAISNLAVFSSAFSIFLPFKNLIFNDMHVISQKHVLAS